MQGSYGMGLLVAAGLVLAAAVPAMAKPAPVPPQDGARASASAARPEADLTSAERKVEAQRRIGEERFRRRDESMRKSMRSICTGC